MQNCPSSLCLKSWPVNQIALQFKADFKMSDLFGEGKNESNYDAASRERVTADGCDLHRTQDSEDRGTSVRTEHLLRGENYSSTKHHRFACCQSNPHRGTSQGWRVTGCMSCHVIWSLLSTTKRMKGKKCFKKRKLVGLFHKYCVIMFPTICLWNMLCHEKFDEFCGLPEMLAFLISRTEQLQKYFCKIWPIRAASGHFSITVYSLRNEKGTSPTLTTVL